MGKERKYTVPKVSGISGAVPIITGTEEITKSLGDLKLYDWERMSDKEKQAVSKTLGGMSIDEIDNILKEKGVETKMEFNIPGDEKKTKFLQKSAQAMIDAYGGRMDKGGFDRDIKLFENTYGDEMTKKLMSSLRSKVDPVEEYKSGEDITAHTSTSITPTNLDELILKSNIRKSEQEDIDALTSSAARQNLSNFEKFIAGGGDLKNITEEEEEELITGSGGDPFAGSGTGVEGEEIILPAFVEEEELFSPELILGSEGPESADVGGPEGGEVAPVEKKEKTKVGKFLESLFKKKKKKGGNNPVITEEEFDPVAIKEKYYKSGGRTLSVPQVYAQETTKVPTEFTAADTTAVMEYRDLADHLGEDPANYFAKKFDLQYFKDSPKMIKNFENLLKDKLLSQQMGDIEGFPKEEKVAKIEGQKRVKKTLRDSEGNIISEEDVPLKQISMEEFFKSSKE